MIRFTRTIALIALAGSVGGCWGVVSENPAGPYLRRTDTITTSAGDAHDANAAVHTIDPWPPGVADPRIRANGERMAGAAERYRKPAQGARSDAQPGQPGASTSGTSGASMTSGTAASGDRSTLPY